MSEATDRRVVSFAQDIIYDVICCNVETRKRVCLAVLLKSRTGPVELVKVRQTLSIVGDSLDISNGLLLDVVYNTHVGLAHQLLRLLLGELTLPNR
jgi:hypothetical protein